MAGVSLITYTVQVGWEVATGNIAVVGSAIVDVSEVGETPFDQVFGPEDDVTESVVDTISIDRGREDPTAVIQAGTATFRLTDPTGQFNPKNESSPLVGLLRPLRQARITAHFAGVDYPRFAGFIRTLSWQPTGRGGIATVDLVDLFVWLERYSPTIASTGVTTTGAAIGQILDAIGWTSPTLRSLDAGDDLSDYSADGTKNALELIEELLAAERGIFYIDPGGVATYRNRNARAEQTVSLATFDSVMVDLSPGTALDNVKNRADVTKTGSTVQHAQDNNSIFLYGNADWPPVDSRFLASDTQAEALAAYLVSIGKDPRAPVWGMSVENRDAATTAAMLELDLIDRVTVVEPQGSTSDDFFVEGYTETIDKERNSHRISYSLTEKSPVDVAIVGTSVVDGPDVVGF